MFKKQKSPTPDPVLHAGRAVYAIDDFSALDDDQVAALRRRAESDVANGLVGCAHLVFARDLRTGLVNHHVPSSNGLEALELAEQVTAERRASEPEDTFTVTVTPLLPHD